MTLNEIIGVLWLIYVVSVLINLCGAYNELINDNQNAFIGFPVLNTILAAKCLYKMFKIVIKEED